MFLGFMTDKDYHWILERMMKQLSIMESMSREQDRLCDCLDCIRRKDAENDPESTAGKS